MNRDQIEKLLKRGIVEPKELTEEQKQVLGWTEEELAAYQQAADSRRRK